MFNPSDYRNEKPQTPKGAWAAGDYLVTINRLRWVEAYDNGNPCKPHWEAEITDGKRKAWPKFYVKSGGPGLAYFNELLRAMGYADLVKHPELAETHQDYDALAGQDLGELFAGRQAHVTVGFGKDNYAHKNEFSNWRAVEKPTTDYAQAFSDEDPPPATAANHPRKQAF